MTRHFDGEFFDFSLGDDGALTVHQGVRPEVTALVTLKNDATGGGTRLFPLDGGASFVLAGKTGDLVTFDNVKYEHGVDELVGTAKADWLRYVIGWRPFEDRCWYHDGEKPLRRLAVAEAASLHRKFLKDVWPAKRDQGPGQAVF